MSLFIGVNAKHKAEHLLYANWKLNSFNCDYLGVLPIDLVVKTGQCLCYSTNYYGCVDTAQCQDRKDARSPQRGRRKTRRIFEFPSLHDSPCSLPRRDVPNLVGNHILYVYPNKTDNKVKFKYLGHFADKIRKGTLHDVHGRHVINASACTIPHIPRDRGCMPA